MGGTCPVRRRGSYIVGLMNRFKTRGNGWVLIMVVHGDEEYWGILMNVSD